MVHNSNIMLFPNYEHEEQQKASYIYKKTKKIEKNRLLVITIHIDV